MRTVTVTLGGQQYTIAELQSRPNSEWRKRLDKEFGEVAKLLSTGSKLELSTDAIAGLLDFVRSTLLGSIDTITELLFAYAPALAADKPRILGESYDSEITDAFIEVLKLAYPFGPLITGLARQIGG